jgi:hypothetical protein
MFSTKTISTVSIIGMLTTAFGDKVIANVVGADMPWFAQFGLCGLFGFLLWWNMERGDKRTAKGMDDLKDEIGGMRTGLKSGQDTTNSLLREALFQNRGVK